MRKYRIKIWVTNIVSIKVKQESYGTFKRGFYEFNTKTFSAVSGRFRKQLGIDQFCGASRRRKKNERVRKERSYQNTKIEKRPPDRSCSLS